MGGGATGEATSIGALFDDEAYFADWVATAGKARVEMHRYAGVGHYFLDPSLDDYDEAAARLCLDRSRAFLKGL